MSEPTKPKGAKPDDLKLLGIQKSGMAFQAAKMLEKNKKMSEDAMKEMHGYGVGEKK